MLETAIHLASLGAAVHWLWPDKKAPIESDWSEIDPKNADELADQWANGVKVTPKNKPAFTYVPAEKGANLGLRPGTPSEVGPGVYLYVLDVDLRSAKIDAALPTIKKMLGDYRKFPRVHTGSGGYHFYFTSHRALRSKLLARGDGWEVELYGTGKNLVLPPSVHPDTGREYKWSTEPPWEALELGIEFPLPDESVLDQVTKETATPASDFENDIPPADLKGLSVHDYLERVPNEDRHYDEWLAVGAALHHQFDGDPEGLDIWEQWSEQSPKHGDREYLERKWESFAVNQKGRKPVTFRTVIDMAGGQISDVDVYKRQIEQSSSVDRAIDIAANATISNVDRDVLAKAVLDRVSKIRGTKPTVEAVRKDIAEKRKALFEVSVTEIEGFRDWVYSYREKSFYHTESGTMYDKEQFSDYWADELYGDSTDEDSDYQPPASRIYIQRRDTKKVHGITYMPGHDRFVSVKGQECVNTWRDTLIEPTEGDAQPFFDHVTRLIPDEANREIFLDFLAAVVLRPGLKIRWVPLLVGEQGNGKTTFTVLLRKLLGDRNITSPENEQLHEKFTDWAFGAQVVAVEELMSHGRIELGNKLKPHITNDYVTVRPFHGKSFDTPNLFNMLMYTNHDNAQVLSQGDRRYFVVDTNPDLANDTAHFDRLYDCIRNRPGAILSELMKRDLTGFEKLAQQNAPRTQAREAMIARTMSPAARQLQSAIDKGAEPFNVPLVVQREATDYLERKMGSRAPTYRETIDVLRELGYRSVLFDDGQDRLKLDGNRLDRIWMPDTLAQSLQAPFTRQQIRSIFQQFNAEDRDRELKKAVAGLRSVQ